MKMCIKLVLFLYTLFVFTLPKFDHSRIICILWAASKATLPGLLMAPLSSQMFALSSTRIYCFYPQLFANKEYMILRGDVDNIWTMPFEDFNFSLMGTDPLYGNDIPCGEICVVVWRRMLLGGKVAMARWGGMNGLWDCGRHVSPANPFFTEGGPFMWRHSMEYSCSNAFCSNFDRTISLHRT